jgi:hypothetical protein
VVAKVRERLAVSKQEAQKFDGKRFNFRKLNELEVGKEYQIEISNRFAALENLCNSEDINMAWENIKENIKTSVKESLCLYELKQHKPWYDVDYLNNVRRKASTHFRNKKKEYLKVKIEELETNSKIKILGTCVGASMTLRRVTRIELTQ